MGNSNSQDVESTAEEVLDEKNANLLEVSRGEVAEEASGPVAEVEEDCSEEEDDGELCEDKKFETVMRVVIHSINDIERETDVGTEIDPYVEVSANQVLLGATKPRTDMTTATVEESFYIKTQMDQKSIKLRFQLKDDDHMTDDDLVGHGYFDLAEEDDTTNQIVHLKWKGKEIGHILISVDFQNLVVM